MALIIELMGMAASGPGLTDEAIHQMILDHGFKPYRYNATTRELTELAGISHEDNNMLYVKGAADVQARLSSAQRFTVIGQEI
jgi:hypothetical protein